MTLNFVLLWAIYLTSFGLLMVEKYFDTINFFKRSNLPSAPLPRFLQGRLAVGGVQAASRGAGVRHVVPGWRCPWGSWVASRALVSGGVASWVPGRCQ